MLVCTSSKLSEPSDDAVERSLNSCYSSFYIVFFRWGHTPLDDARTFGHNSIVEYLNKWSKGNSTQEEITKDKDAEEKEVSKPDLKTPTK